MNSGWSLRGSNCKTAKLWTLITFTLAARYIMLLAWREVEHAPRMSKKSVSINKSVCLFNKNNSPFYSLWDTNIQSLPMQLKLQIVSQYFQLDMYNYYTVSVVAPLHACVKRSADVVLCLYILITMAYHCIIFLSRAAAQLSFYSWEIVFFFFKKGWWNKLCMSWGIAGGVRLGIRLVCFVARYPCSWMYSNSLFISPHLFHWNVHGGCHYNTSTLASQGPQ